MAADIRPTQAIPAFQPRRLTHANFFVENMERSMDFYKDIIGLGESYRRVKSRGGFLTNGNTHHDLGVMEYSERLGGKRAKRFIGFYHVAFEMESDRELHGWYERASAAGANFYFLGDHGNTHSIYLLDPDGNQVEVYTDTLKEWWTLKTGYIPTIQSSWKPDDTSASTEPKYHAEPEIQTSPHSLFHPRRTTRASFVLARYEEGLAFYRDLIGLTLIAGGAEASFAAFAGNTGDHCLTIWRPAPTRPLGFHHVSLEVGTVDDLRASAMAARARTDIRIVREIDHPARYAVLIEDIDGFLIQLYADRAGSSIDWNSIDPEVAFFLA